MEKKKVVIAKIQVIKGKENKFIALVSPLTELSKAEPGNLVYSLYQDASENSRFIAYEEYTNEEACNYHCSAAHFQAFVENVKPLLVAEIDIQVF